MEPNVHELLHQNNIKSIQRVAAINQTDKRRMFALIRKTHNLNHMNFIFTEFGGITLGQFATGILLSKSRGQLPSRLEETEEENVSILP